MSKVEAAHVGEQLEKNGVIIKLEVVEKGFFSPMMFLRKTESKNIKKVVDFGLLIVYANCTEAKFPGTSATIRKVPEDWQVFTSIDLTQGYVHIRVCDIAKKILF